MARRRDGNIQKRRRTEPIDRREDGRVARAKSTLNANSSAASLVVRMWPVSNPWRGESLSL